MSRLHITFAALLTACGIFVAGLAPSAHADTWVYPGGVSCADRTALTASNTSNGTLTEHRAEGYGGYYYASWAATWWTQYREKQWEWYDILSSRIGTTGNGGVISTAVVACG
jgi:hypothetical protein